MKNKNTTLRTAAALAGAAAVLAGTATAVPASPAAPADDRGRVLSAVRVAHMSRAEVARYLSGSEPALTTPKPRHGVDTYRVIYRTISAGGRPTTASGVVSLPAGVRAPRAVSFTHGTHAGKAVAGSIAEDGQTRIAAIYYAGAGFAGVAPDYLGLGFGPGFHPYGDTASEASASLDMLRAARTLATSHGVTLDRRVLVTGFSQGGQAAMALGRELQRDADPYLRLGALAPISGPYELERAQIPESLPPDGGLTPKFSVFYFAYIVTAWNRLHHLYDTPAEAFRAPYDGIVEALFDGGGDFEEIRPHLPGTVAELLTPGFLQRLRHPTGALRRALDATDGACDWAPKVPVRLYAAAGDEQVPRANTTGCAATLRAHGTTPQVVDYGRGTDHFGTLLRGLPDTLRWFQALP